MVGALHALDVTVVGAYITAVLALSGRLARRQRTGEDYFLAGRTMRGGTLALSILANQASAVSLVGAPAFVALREGGGLRWLQYELALPLAMAFVMAVLLPALRSLPSSSIYVFGEQRFGRATRRVLAAIFLLSRGLALGVVLYASALVVAETAGWPLWPTLALIGGVSVAYTSLGGIVADIWSDVLQLAVLWVGTIIAALHVLGQRGQAVLEAIPAERTSTLVMDAWGVGDSPFGFWPMLVGGLFLYASYYGCDQSQAQRLLTARDERAARHALLLNGLLRFPLVLTYCALGLLLAGLLRTDATFASAMAGRPDDSLVPVFLVSYLPAGVRGLMLAAILAAAMSSIDSAMNSLAAVTLEDVFDRPAARQRVWVSRLTSLAWGLFAVGSAIGFARSGAGVLEGINRIGSAFYGPVLAVFVMGVLAPGVGEKAVLTGLAAGLAVNGLLAWRAPAVSWLWWNPVGFCVAAGVARARSHAGGGVPVVKWPRAETVALVASFLVILAVLVSLR